jgi:predicted DNA-binding transcriptional regulator AlpA
VTEQPQQQQPHSRTPKEAARYINVSEAALRLWRRRGAGPRYFLAGPRLIRYRQIDLDAWIEAHVAPQRGAAEVSDNVPSAAVSPQESLLSACAHLGGVRSMRGV